jgi:lysophospholipase L1-like esterase
MTTDRPHTYIPALDGLRAAGRRLWRGSVDDRLGWIAAGLKLAVCVVAIGLGCSRHPSTGPDLLAYGDSIVVGRGIEDRWADMVGASVDAQWGRALTDDVGAASRIIAARPHQLWIAIGTNDFGKSKATPAQFEERYARLVDEVHQALPATTIYAQTPLVRRKESPNKLGASLPEYRSAIQRVCDTRSWLRCVDGRRILRLDDMPDGLHPGDGAQDRYANYVKSMTVE